MNNKQPKGFGVFFLLIATTSWCLSVLAGNLSPVDNYFLLRDELIGISNTRTRLFGRMCVSSVSNLWLKSKQTSTEKCTTVPLRNETWSKAWMDHFYNYPETKSSYAAILQESRIKWWLLPFLIHVLSRTMSHSCRWMPGSPQGSDWSSREWMNVFSYIQHVLHIIMKAL